MRRNLAGMLTVGVTGTKGKTSTTEFVAQLLEAQGLVVAVSTTESARIGPRYYEGFWSVPELERFVRLARQAAVDCVVVELCSSGLRWDLHTAFALDVAILTNIGTDHIRDHGNRRNYVATKQKMFRGLGAAPGRRGPIAILNADDPAVGAFRACLEPEVVRVLYGTRGLTRVASGHRRLIARGIAGVADGTRFTIHGLAPGPLDCETGLRGAFNVSNVLAAIACATSLGFDPRAVVRAASLLIPPPGRFDILTPPSDSHPGVVVDYAHTPESLAAAMQAARGLSPLGRLHLVFGCGGDAYKGKRPLMGALAARLADDVVVTSDNPRRESPAAIARGIIAGIPRAARRSIRIDLDRRSAIDHAIGTASGGDIVLIAGKGNERTQDIGGRARPFSDVRVASRALDARLRRDGAPALRLDAPAAVVLDAEGLPRFAQHAERPRAPASLVKLMTLYLAFEALARGRVTPDATVDISASAATTPHPRLRLRAGDRVRVRSLLQAVAIRSSNAAATALAEAIAGNESTFVARMNETAEILGLDATRFANAHGLPHRHQRSTALDLARLLQRLCRDHHEARALLGRQVFAFRGARYVRTATLPRRRGVLALKTGFTWEAGYNLAIAWQAPGVDRQVVVLGASSRARSFADARRLLDLDVRTRP
jgi:UDP-N-acetylmuramyl-tripeptide synthetase